MKHGRQDYNARIQDSAGIIPAAEPVFLLRGQDRFAARLVRAYAEMLEAEGVAPQAHIAAIRSHALEMTNWRPKKVPDAPDSAIGHVPGVSPQPNSF